MKTFITAFIVVCTLIGPCASLECYVCYGDEEECGDPINSTSAIVVECLRIPICWAYQNKKTGSVFRNCAPTRECTNMCTPLPSVDSWKDVCVYCCEDDFCNSRSVADAVADVIQCYTCSWSSDSPDNSSCNDPFDPNGEGVILTSCDGECGISKTDIPSDGGSSIVRGCFSPQASQSTQCQPGCNGQGTCMTCCAENLCNGGPVTPPTTASPNGAPSFVSKERGATLNLAAIPLMYMYIASVN